MIIEAQPYLGETPCHYSTPELNILQIETAARFTGRLDS